MIHMLSIFLLSSALYSSIATTQKPFALQRTYSNVIDGEYLIFFDINCLAQTQERNEDVVQQFLDLFQCYSLNTEKVDLYPDIVDHWIVVNRRSNCNLNDNTKIELSDYCIESVEQDRIITVDSASSKSSKCECSSKTVADELYNLDSLTPEITDGFEFIECETDYDPRFDLIVMDSGVSEEHEEFDGITFERLFNAYPLQEFSDHGTHVAGILCGDNYGAFSAKNTKVKLLDVRTISQSNRAVLCDYLNSYCAIIQYLTDKKRKAIINISLGDKVVEGESAQHNKYLKMVRGSGGIIISSAGNSNTDACGQQPAASPDTIAVGNVDRDFNKVDSSNYGICVDIWAPGKDILSADIDGGSTTKTGTSMSSPLVAGVAANILMANPKFDFQDIYDTLLNGAMYDVDFVTDDGQVFVDEPRVQGSCKIYDTKPCKKKHKKKNKKKHKKKKKKNHKKSHSVLSDNNANDEQDVYHSANSDKITEYVISVTPRTIRHMWVMAAFVLFTNMILCGLYYQQNRLNISK